MNAQQASAPVVTTAQRHVVHVTNAPGLLAAPAPLRASTAEAGPARSVAPVRTLGDASLITRDGATVALSAAMPKGDWVLLYRTAQCLACDRLMNALGDSGAFAHAPAKQMIVVVGEPAVQEHKASGRRTAMPEVHTLTRTDELNGLEAARSANGRLGDATWLSDDGDRLYQALKAQGAPLMLGMRGNTIIWRTAGVGADAANMPARVADWMSRQAPSAAADSSNNAAGAKTTPTAPTAPAVAAKQAVAR